MKLLYSILFMVFLSPFAMGQEPTSIMNKAKEEVEKENFDNALLLMEPLLAKYPENEEIKIYIGRIYSWKKNYDAAIAVLSPLTDKGNPHPDALLAIINTCYWAGQLEKCISYCDKYLALEPNATNVAVIKANCLQQLNRDTEALSIIDRISISDNNTQAISGLRTLIGRKAKNAISASYLNVSTYNPGQLPLHYGYIEYSHKFTSSSLAGRVNIGHVNGNTQELFEADYYKTFRNKSYLYVNGGASTGEKVFPVARAGIEYYFAPLKRFEFSLGVRYMNFNTEDVTLLTGQMAYHTGPLTFAYRPFYDTASGLLSHVASVQNTNEEKERILRLELQYGNVPYLYLYSSFVEPLKAYRVGLQYQHRVGSSFFIRPVFLYEYEEYLPGEYRHKFNVQLILTKRF